MREGGLSIEWEYRIIMGYIHMYYGVEVYNAWAPT